jgi:hypothetical protein
MGIRIPGGCRLAGIPATMRVEMTVAVMLDFDLGHIRTVQSIRSYSYMPWPRWLGTQSLPPW